MHFSQGIGVSLARWNLLSSLRGIAACLQVRPSGVTKQRSLKRINLTFQA